MLAQGVTHFLVDWESLGKPVRQLGFDTEIAPVGVAELAAVAEAAPGRTWCRINQDWALTAIEVEQAIGAGASGIFLPMVRHPAEVDRFLGYVRARCQVGILVETVEALQNIKALAERPIDRVYFGLNDFAISRGGGSIFRALLDGSVERARQALPNIDFGFGGITAIEKGDPIPCHQLIQEMARIGCQFSFMRRSFRKDVASVGTRALVEDVQTYWRRCRQRTAAEVASDQTDLNRRLVRVCHGA